jgi:hypothetical protein
MVAHRDLTGADLHEPKGTATAPNHAVYVANGAGSGAWALIGPNSFASTVKNVNKFFLTVVIPDISTANAILLPLQRNATLVQAIGVLSGAITVANAVVTLSRNGTDIMGTFTVTHSGSAEGDTYTITSPTFAAVDAGDYVKISTNGASTGTRSFTVVLEFDLT